MAEIVTRVKKDKRNTILSKLNNKNKQIIKDTYSDLNNLLRKIFKIDYGIMPFFNTIYNELNLSPLDESKDENSNSKKKLKKAIYVLK